MKTQFAAPGTFPKLGPIGRTVRVLLGVAILYLIFPPFLKHWQAFTRLREGWDMPGGTWYLPVVLALYLLPTTLDRLFTVNWAWRSQAAWGGLLAALAGFDLFYYRSLWGPPLGWFLLLSIVLVFGVVGVSFLVQGVAATPG